MRVSEIMTTAVVSVRQDTPVHEVARLMVEHDVSGLPVLDDGRLIGLVTDRDVIARHAEPDMPTIFSFLGGFIHFGEREYEEEMRRILATTAAALMSDTVYSVLEDATIEEVAELMYEQGANPVPVLNAGHQVVGIVSRSDLVRLFLRQGD